MDIQEEHPFHSLTPRQQEVVLRWAGVPMTPPALEDTLSDELPGLDLAVFPIHIGGRGSNGYIARLDMTWMPCVRVGKPTDGLICLDVPEEARQFHTWLQEQADNREMARGR